jgi:hypothetical protein
MNVHTPTETLSCSATGRREWRVTPVVVERPLDDTTLSASTPRTRRDAGLSDPSGSLCRSDAPDDGYSHAEADIGRADIGPLSVEKYSTDVTPRVPTPRPSAPPAGRELG